jgi:hypothetical protein
MNVTEQPEHGQLNVSKSEEACSASPTKRRAGRRCVGCGGLLGVLHHPGTRRGGIGEGDGRTLKLIVGSCNADLTAEVEESPSQVTVTVTARDDTSDDCLDGLIVHLDQPLGDRQLLDGVTRDVVSVRHANR